MRARRLPVPPATDVALAAAATAGIMLITRHLSPTADLTGGERGVDALGYAAMAVAGASLALRRRLPLTAVGVVTAALFVYLLRGYPGGPIFVALYVTLYTLATLRDRSLAFAAAAVSSGTLFAVGLVSHNGPQRLTHLVFMAWAVAAVLLGDTMRSRRERVSAIEERARQLEQSREEEARRRVAEERLRIARDLHDSVAHSMATINVQAGVAAHLIDRRPDQAREALRGIELASREVLDELTAMLQLLRVDRAGSDRAPTPGLDQLDALVESVRRAGVDVTLDGAPLDGQRPEVPQPVGVAAYRIVQESLTNVIKHAGAPARAWVRLNPTRDGGLTVEIEDDGRGAPQRPAGPGVGLIGMRERAEATGGRLEAGSRPGGGFAVRVTWPGRA